MSNPQALVLVDKIPSVLEPVVTSLKGEGFEVEITSDCETASRLVVHRRSAIVLVGNLGDQMSRWEFCKYLRGVSPSRDLAIIVALPESSRLTAIRCLEDGADACMTLPLTGEALAGRIRMLRRATTADDVLLYKGLEVNLATQRAIYDGRLLRLNVPALSLLACLVRQPEQEISRAELGVQLGLNNRERMRRIDSQIHKIRLAFRDARCPHVVRTIRMQGYSLSTRLVLGMLAVTALAEMGVPLLGFQIA